MVGCTTLRTKNAIGVVMSLLLTLLLNVLIVQGYRWLRPSVDKRNLPTYVFTEFVRNADTTLSASGEEEGPPCRLVQQQYPITMLAWENMPLLNNVSIVYPSHYTSAQCLPVGNRCAKRRYSESIEEEADTFEEHTQMMYGACVGEVGDKAISLIVNDGHDTMTTVQAIIKAPTNCVCVVGHD